MPLFLLRTAAPANQLGMHVDSFYTAVVYSLAPEIDSGQNDNG